MRRDARESRLFSDGRRRAPCTLADAQLFIARLHDFVELAQVRPRTSRRSRESDRRTPSSSPPRTPSSPGDTATLRSMLRTNPGLVRARSARDHAATLLHYIAANGHEGYRQKTPKNAVEIARVLLDAGAEPDALAHMYGGDATTMDMLVSSVHPHIAGVQVALVDSSWTTAPR